MAGFKAIRAGYKHFVLLKHDGTVWCFGENEHGQLGDRTYNKSDSLVRVYGLTDVVGIAAGFSFSLALKSDGTVWGWGHNAYKQLGTASPVKTNIPQQVPGLSGIKQIETGFYHAAALKSDGTVYTWGQNASFCCGRGSTGYEYLAPPAQVPALTGIQRIETGDNSTWFKRGDGTWLACGTGIFTDLGDAVSPGYQTTETPNAIIPATIIAGSTFIRPGPPHMVSHITAAGVAKTDGDETNTESFGDGILGGPVPDGYEPLRFGPTNLTGATFIARNGDTCFVVFGGRLYAAGYNGYGQIGNGLVTETMQDIPVRINVPGRVKAVAITNWDGVAAITETGSVYRWGDHDLTNYIATPELYYSAPVEIPVTIDPTAGRLRLWSPDRAYLWAETSNYRSLQIARRFTGNSLLECYFSKGSDEEYYIPEGGWIEDDEGDWYRIRFRRATKDGVQVIAYGPHCLLSQRVTVPTAGAYGIDATGSADAVVKTLISASLRGLPILNAANRAGTSLSETSRYKNLGEEVRRICEANGLGERFTKIAEGFLFDTYSGTDRTRGNMAGNAPAVFSVRYDNLEDWAHSVSAVDEVTTVYVAGQGEGAARKIVIVGDGALDEERCELFRDARDTNLTSILTSRGNESISPVAESFSAKANTNSNLDYNEDYQLGDLVTVEIPERTAVLTSGEWVPTERYRSENKRITETIRTYQGGSLDVDLVFGDAPKTRGDKQVELKNNLTRLEAI